MSPPGVKFLLATLPAALQSGKAIPQRLPFVAPRADPAIMEKNTFRER
tara:strand:- start:293 stop:436 length:144 start_codon:yes stop_codon:yes gene_type:complete